MEAIRSTCWQGMKRLLGFRTAWTLQRRGRCCARVLRHLTRCGIAGRLWVTWLACKESAGWDIWEFSLRQRPGIAWRPLDADQKMVHWQRNWGRPFTLTQMQRTLQKS